MVLFRFMWGDYLLSPLKDRWLCLSSLSCGPPSFWSFAVVKETLDVESLTALSSEEGLQPPPVTTTIKNLWWTPWMIEYEEWGKAQRTFHMSHMCEAVGCPVGFILWTRTELRDRPASSDFLVTHGCGWSDIWLIHTVVEHTTPLGLTTALRSLQFSLKFSGG